MKNKTLVYVGAGIALYFGYQWYKKRQIQKQVDDLLKPPMVLRSSGNVVAKAGTQKAPGKSYVLKNAPAATVKQPDFASPEFDWTQQKT